MIYIRLTKSVLMAPLGLDSGLGDMAASSAPWGPSIWCLPICMSWQSAQSLPQLKTSYLDGIRHTESCPWRNPLLPSGANIVLHLCALHIDWLLYSYAKLFASSCNLIGFLYACSFADVFWMWTHYTLTAWSMVYLGTSFLNYSRCDFQMTLWTTQVS